jgi:PST family polysaccharide transporter
MGWRLLDILRVSLLVPLANTAMPAFSRMQSNLALVRSAIQSGVRLSALIGFPAFLGLAAVAPDLIPSLFGTQWAGGVRVVQVLALLGALWSLTHFYGAAMRGLGRPIMQLAPQVLGVAVLIVLLLIFGRYGIEATAWCIPIRTLLLLPLTTYLAYRVTGLEIDKQHRACLLPLGSAVAMAAVVVCWRLIMIGTLSSPMMLASSVLVGVVVYCGCIVLLDRNITRQVVDLARTAAARKPVAGADL